jgi:hypothetical protein
MTSLSGTRAAARVSHRSIQVQFLGVPVATYLALEVHNDETMRELLILSGSHGADGASAASPRLAAIAERVLRHWGREKDAFRLRVEEAEDVGAVTVDLVADFAPGPLAAADDHVALLEEVDGLRRLGELFGAPPAPGVAELRRWFVEEMRAQVVDGRVPRPFGAG